MDERRRHRSRHRGRAPRRATGRRAGGRATAPRRALAASLLAGDVAQLRLPIPPGLVRMVERGLARPEDAPGAAGFWRWVERRMHRLVYASLPAGAARVALRLDPETLEVVARFERGGRP